MTNWQKMTARISFIAIACISGCAGKSAVETAHAPDVHCSGERVAGLLMRQVGAPYRFGGESPEGFDCSGLVRYVYRQVGIDIPHSSGQIYRMVRRIELSDAHPGDLLFFRISGKKISHVGVYVDAQTFIHAPSSGKKVRTARLDNPYWQRRLFAVGRIPGA